MLFIVRLGFIKAKFVLAAAELHMINPTKTNMVTLILVDTFIRHENK